jgi:hypothetical protein
MSVNESGSIEASGSVVSYGYGKRYGEEYSGPTPTTRSLEVGRVGTDVTLQAQQTTARASESGQTSTNVTLATTETRLSTESGEISVSAVLDVLEETEPRFEQGTITAVGDIAGTEVATSSESGSTPISATLAGTDIKRDLLTGRITATASLSPVDSTPVAIESGRGVGTVSLAGTESATAQERGVTTIAGAWNGTPLAQAFESGDFDIAGELSGLDKAIIIESGRITSTALIFYTPYVRTDATDPLQAIANILDGIDPQFYQFSNPDSVQPVWDVTQKGRENDPRPALYVWSPVESTEDAFSGDYGHLDEMNTIQVDVWTLDPQESLAYANDIVDLLTAYGRDNENLTQFLHIRPQTVNDTRAEKVVRQTDHYVTSVQIEIRNYRETLL